MKKTTQEIIMGAAREQAESLILHAVKSAKNQDQINNQISMIEEMAVIILGSVTFNNAMFSQRSFETEVMVTVDLLKERIHSEVERLKKAKDSGEMEHVQPGE